MRWFFPLCLGVWLVLLSVLPICREANVSGAEYSIKPDERVVFFPTAARLSDDGGLWIIPLHGWIFEPEPGGVLREAVVRQFRARLGLEADQPSTSLFEERIRLFLVDNERGKRIRIRIGGAEPTLDASARDGHFTGTVRLPAETVKRQLTEGRLRYEAVMNPADRRQFYGLVHCLPPEGVSVISDIDDTIKISEVLNKKKLIANTFLREFRAVEGMAAEYRRWADAGAQFHFVSASPWQLYEPLSTFARQAGFPEATFHLKRFRFKDSTLLELFKDPIQYKLAVIEPLLQDYPKRQFVLVGDSGEKDPEVYGVVARSHAEQVKRIYIRDVSGEPADSLRYRKAFDGLPRDTWRVFRDASRLERPE